MPESSDFADLPLPCTRLELFLRSRGLRPAAFAREASINRNYLLRVRKALLEPSRAKVAAMVSAARRLLHENVPAEDLFELSSEEGGVWVTLDLHHDMIERARATSRVERLAAARVAEVIAGPAKRWRETLHPVASLPVVRQLLAHAARRLDAAPRDAIQLFEIAHDLVEHVRSLGEDERAELRGRTFLDRAYACRQMGELHVAAEMLDQAERLFEVTPYCYDQLGQTWYELGALAFRRCDLEAAVRLARRARCTFIVLGDLRRAAKTRILEGSVEFARQNLDAAADLFTAAIAPLTSVDDPTALASAYVNLGSVDTLRGNVAAAKGWLERARRIFERSGARGELARVRWTSARLRVLHEDRADGLMQMRRVRADLAALGMSYDAAIVALELIEFLLDDPAAGDEARGLARQVSDELQRTGVPTNALEALQYLREAIHQMQATPLLARNVRLFIRRAPFCPDERFEKGDVA